jgi:AraC family transcriptional regulator
MKIDVINRQPVKAACLRYTGPFGEPLAKFWRATVTPWLARHELLDCPRYGVSLDNPRDIPPEQCRYDACVENSRDLAFDDAEQGTIAGGRYAVTNFKGTGATIGDAWAAFVSEALANPAWRIDPKRYPFEHYPRGAATDVKTGVFSCQLFLPLSS